MAARQRAAAMKIGDLIMYQGRQWILRGIDPMGVPDRRAQLEDPESGERISVPLAALASDEV